MARKHKEMPKTPRQFDALSLFSCVLLALICGQNILRYNMLPRETLGFQPVDDKPLFSKANRHLLDLPLLSFVAIGGIAGAIVVYVKRPKR